MWRWLGRNLSTLLLAFLLALVVWVSAVFSTDPNSEGAYPRAVPLEVVGQDPSLMQVGAIPSSVRISLNAPQSIWNQLNVSQEHVRAWIDVTGLGEGTHLAPVHIQVRLTPVQVVKIDPVEVSISLEQLITQELPIRSEVTGDPALGYRMGAIQLDPAQVVVSGPKSQTDKVAAMTVALDVTGATDTVRKSVAVQPLDASGNVIMGLNVSPPVVEITQAISLLGGYRNVVVKVVSNGQVLDGYWLTNVSVTPPNVTVFSTNPSLVNDLPGFVETFPLDLTGLNDDVDVRAELNLPEGVTLAGEGSVLVRLSIAALEGSLPITLPLEVVGLPPELAAFLSPDSVDLLLTGPLPLLNNLTPGGIRVSVNLNGLEPGVHQVVPVVDLLPAQINVASILPESVEVTIVENGDITPTPTGTPIPTQTPTPTP